MRDMLSNRMSELKFEAPLAQFEEADDWTNNAPGTVYDYYNSAKTNAFNDDMNNCNDINENKPSNDIVNLRPIKDVYTDSNENVSSLQDLVSQMHTTDSEEALKALVDNKNVDNFNETFSASLEDLVNTFDEKITKCFGNYEEPVEELAPVQIRTQEELMTECQMWWTLTGNFGNILPIDWSKSYTRKMHLESLNLNEPKDASPDDDLLTLSSEDEAVANDLDMHSMILNSRGHDEIEPIKTADEVIREIDDIMKDESSPDDTCASSITDSEMFEKGKAVLNSPLYEDKLKSLSLTQLNELYLELELLIREFSETLISELALRDELEYEKELKNTFISLLLSVQNKRRQFHVEKKRKSKDAKEAVKKGDLLEPKYLTTVIPYHLENGTPDNQQLQVLIKILKAIDEDSPTVPTLLTDYILKVLCPT